MKSNSRCMSATILFVVASLMFAGLEPAAFGAAADEAPTSGQSAESAPKPLPKRPVIVTTSAPPNAPIAQALQSPTRPSTPSIRTAYTPPARQNTGKSKKWIWIVAAAAGAAITTGVLVSRNGDEPTITLFTPSVGEPE